MTDDDTMRLLEQVRPADWRNPEPARLYDLVVIGGGTAGLVSAVGAAGLGACVALVERDRLGGDCLNTGCVPSKTLLRSARAVHEAGAAAAVGVHMTPQVDFSAAMAAVAARRADIAPHDSAARLASLGVDVFFGEAAFADTRTVTVDGRALRFRRAVIATGSRPFIPPIAGLSTVPYLTNESVFSLTRQPRRLLVIGGGPIGCELAQAFALLGTAVTLVETAPRVLPLEDAEASEILHRRLAEDGIRLMTGMMLSDISAAADSGVTARFGPDAIGADAVLVAAGRQPSVSALHLEAARVDHGPDGIVVDEWLRTSNRRIYAAGDVCSPFKFTHAADAMARVVVRNALFPVPRRASALVIPWTTYTFPEVAHVGLRPPEAVRRGAERITVSFRDVDRAIIDGEGEGFVRVHHQRGRIVAATIVSSRAGELIGQLASIMRRRGSVAELSSEIFPYPTCAEALRKVGDTYRRERLTPAARRILGRYFAFRRWSG